MCNRILGVLAAWLLAVSCLAEAAPLPGDVTGMWFDASHPGWGLGVARQNDLTFATLFIYDANGAPQWYVASRLEARDPGVTDSCGVRALEGTLYRTQWPTFSSGDPSGSPQVTAVGSISFYVATDPRCDAGTGQLIYSIDNVSRVVNVTRETWSSNQARLYGSFQGGLAFPSTIGISPPPPCADVNALLLPASGRQLVIDGAADLSADNASGVLLAWGTGVDTVCVVRGRYAQGGQLGTVAGTLSCGPVGSPSTPVGAIKLSNLSISDAGFVGDATLDVTATACHYAGTISGARHP